MFLWFVDRHCKNRTYRILTFQKLTWNDDFSDFIVFVVFKNNKIFSSLHLSSMIFKFIKLKHIRMIRVRISLQINENLKFRKIITNISIFKRKTWKTIKFRRNDKNIHRRIRQSFQNSLICCDYISKMIHFENYRCNWY